MPPRLVRPVATTITVALLGLGAVLAVLPWWQGRAIVGPWPGALIAGGQLTGLLGGYLLLVEVLLVARTPWLETRVGADRVTAWHRALGESTVALLLVHAVLLVIGYGVARRVGVLEQTVQIIWLYAGGLTATVGTVLLVVVGVSSLRIVRRRWSWERWYGVHLLAYAGIGLGFVHQLLLGRDLADLRVATLWTGVHLAVASAVLWSRVLTPLRVSRSHRLHVRAVVPEGPTAVSVLIGGRRLDELDATPGQFFRWRFLARGLWWQAHPFSLSAGPTGEGLRITVRTRAGDHSARLAAVRPGTPLIAEGPSGALGGMLAGRRPLLLVAGGIGVTVMRALLDVPPRSEPPATSSVPVLVHRASSPDDAVFAAELAELHAAGRLRYVPLIGPSARLRLDADALTEMVPDLAARSAVVCGPDPMIRQARAALREAGLPRRHIHAERFRLD